MKILSRLLFAFVVTLILGCGGLGSQIGSSYPKVNVKWPSLNRSVEAPTYALSAGITITNAATNKSTHWFIDRPSGSDEQTLTYACSEPLRTGNALLTVEFFALPGGMGDIVATAAASVKVDENGNLLNSSGGDLGIVTFNTVLHGISLNISDIGVGASVPLVVTGYTGGSVIALPQDLVHLSISDNSPSVSLVDHTLTGVSEGYATVQIDFETTSSSSVVQVIPRTQSTILIGNFRAEKITWDPAHNKIWGTFGPNALYPNSIVEIDPVSGSIGNPIFVGSSPEAIAISSDGTVAYVGINGASALRKVDLVNRVATTTTYLTLQSQPAVAHRIAVNPSDANEVAVCIESPFSSAFAGPYIYRGGVQLGPDPGIYSASSVVYTSSNTLVGVQAGISSGNVYRISTAANTVDFVQTISTGTFLGDKLSLTGQKLVTSSGIVFDINNLNQLGTVTLPEGTNLSTFAAPGQNVAWSFYPGNSIFQPRVYIRSFDLNTYAPTDASTITVTTFTDFATWGSSGLAMATGDGLLIIDSLPGLF